MSETDVQKKNEQEVKKCFDFWRDIPIIKEFDVETYNQVIAATPRMDILDILVEGIEEEYPVGKKGKLIRRALSATEIFDRLNGNEKKGIVAKLSEDEWIKRNNLYFHIDKMLAHGLINEIAKTETGRRSTTYFGRVAKIVIPSRTGSKSDTQLLLHPDFKTFVKRVNPATSDKEIDNILLQTDRKNNYQQYPNIKKWLMKYEKETRDLDLDMRKLLELLSIVVRYDDEAMEGLRKLAEVLYLDEIKMMRYNL